MKKLWLIILRESAVRLRKPAFWVVTLLVPLAVAAIFLLPIEAAKRAARPTTVLVVDETGLFAGRLHSTDVVHFRTMPTVEYAENERHEGDLLLLIPLRETYMPRDATLFYRGTRPPSLAVQGAVDGQLQQLLRTAILEDVYGLSPDERHSVESSHIHLRIRDAVSGREGMARMRIAVAIVLSVLMTLALFLFGVQVMRAVQEERQNRIAEVLATSVRPLQLMAGKIAGVALAALVQLLIWSVLAVVGVSVTRLGMASAALAAVPNLPLLISCFVIAFLLGFLLYGGLLAAFGVFLIMSALAAFPSESSWGSVYSTLGSIVLLTGLSILLRTAMRRRGLRVLCVALCAVLLLGIFSVTDYLAAVHFNQVPRFRYETTYDSRDPDRLVYKTLFFDAVLIDPGTEQERVEIVKK